jgi:hypothetical protein
MSINNFIILIFLLGLALPLVGEFLFLINSRRLNTKEAILFSINFTVMGFFLLFIIVIFLFGIFASFLPYGFLNNPGYIQFPLIAIALFFAFWISKRASAKVSDPSGTSLTLSYITVSSLAFAVFVTGFWMSALEFYTAYLY